jgi:hypothetical protein
MSSFPVNYRDDWLLSLLCHAVDQLGGPCHGTFAHYAGPGVRELMEGESEIPS